MSESAESKKHAASQTKLSRQRKKGAVANGQDATGLLACALGMLFLAVTAGAVMRRLDAIFALTFEQIDAPFDEAREVVVREGGTIFLSVVGPLVGITLLAAFVVAVLYNKGFVMSVEPATPQLDRINPVNGLKRIYGKRGLVETPVSFVRLLVWGLIAGSLLIWPLVTAMRTPHCLGACLTDELGRMAWPVVAAAVLVLIVCAGVDMLIQRGLFLDEQKMTDTERKHERKDQYGSPELRQERRRRLNESLRSRRKPLADNATMCFYDGDRAVGIEFRPPKVTLPYVMVRTDTKPASDELRALIRAKGWPEKEHPGLTRAGFSAPLGDFLDASTFQDFVDAVEELFADSR